MKSGDEEVGAVSGCANVTIFYIICEDITNIYI